MADIQSATAEIRRGKKRKKKDGMNKRQDENIMACAIPSPVINRKTDISEETLWVSNPCSQSRRRHAVYGRKDL